MATRLVGDIGGTNARFALSEDGGPVADERKLPVAGHGDFAGAVEAYLAGRPVRDAVFAVATPVLGDEVRFTNSPWRFSIAGLRDRLGLSGLTVINDFVAQASALPALGPADLRTLREGEDRPGRPRLVIGPGTGLGVAFLVERNGVTEVLPSEGGHASFAPQDETGRAVEARLRARHGHVSNERLVSGPGLLAIASILGELRGQPLGLTAPPEVSERARGGCATCREALGVFAAALGNAAGSLALTLLTSGGVYVTGGLCRNLGDLLDTRALTAAFDAKGRFSGLLEGIPIRQVIRPHAGLLGAALHAG